MACCFAGGEKMLLTADPSEIVLFFEFGRSATVSHMPTNRCKKEPFTSVVVRVESCQVKRSAINNDVLLVTQADCSFFIATASCKRSKRE